MLERGTVMKSFWIRTENGHTVLEQRGTSVPEPGRGEVLLRMRSGGLNRGEFIAGHGLHAAGAARPSGIEGAGEVEEIGPGVANLKKGDRVMGRCRGAFADFALMDAREAIPVPQALSWDEAAAVPLAFMTVHDMLIAQGHLQSGEWLLVTGASSGIGVASLQVAKAIGAGVIGTSGSQEKLARLKSLGLDLGIRTRGPDFADAVMRSTGGKGVDLVVNNVGGSVFAECIRALAFEGRFATVGYVDGVMTSDIDIDALHSKRLTLFGVSNKLRSVEQRAQTVRGFVADLLPFIAEGRIRPVIDRVFRFSELPAAKDYMESNAHLGKIVVRTDAG